MAKANSRYGGGGAKSGAKGGGVGGAKGGGGARVFTGQNPKPQILNLKQ